jgi:hypothetical protein
MVIRDPFHPEGTPMQGSSHLPSSMNDSGSGARYPDRSGRGLRVDLIHHVVQRTVNSFR